jgi:hypothetical protein
MITGLLNSRLKGVSDSPPGGRYNAFPLASAIVESCGSASWLMIQIEFALLGPQRRDHIPVTLSLTIVVAACPDFLACVTTAFEFEMPKG